MMIFTNRFIMLTKALTNVGAFLCPKVGDSMAVKVHCNNNTCKYNNDKECTCYEVYYVDRLCLSYKRRYKEADYRQLMKASTPNSCHKEHGKYISNSGKMIK